MLQSACYDELAKRRHLEAVLLRSQADERLNAAFKLGAAQSPRAVLLAEMDDSRARSPARRKRSGRSPSFRNRRRSSISRSATRNDVPGWGHAQAYLALGVQLQERGDTLGARNWIEKSLIVAPDYKAAQRQMASLVHR